MSEAMHERLSGYISHMNEIANEKSNLEEQMKKFKCRMEKEKETMKARLCKEVESTRKALEHELDQKTRLQVLEQEQHAELTKLRPQVMRARCCFECYEDDKI